MTTARLQEQVERIVDEGSGSTRSVIVQLHPPGGVDPRLTAVANTVGRRRLVQSARDCLPAAREGGQGSGAATAAAMAPTGARGPARLPGSVSAQIGPALGPPAASGAGARAAMVAALDELAAHERVRPSLAAAPGSHQALWVAGAMALELPVDDLVALTREVERIAAVHLNRRLPAPPVVEATNLPPQILESRAASWGVQRIGALAAWGAYQSTGEGARVGVVDTGVDATHPDLLRPDGTSKVFGWAEFDGNGQEVAGSTPHDDRGHGTHVCGTIAGGNASGQWIGVAPGAELYVTQVLGPQGGTDAQVLAGIGWAVDQAVDVVSMSLGGLTIGPETPSTYTAAIVTALGYGIPVVVAIGNDGAGTSGAPGNDLFAVGVGATDHRDVPAGFSGGRTQFLTQSDFVDPSQLPIPYTKPELSAPGVGVVSSWPGGQYRALDGTSMATPHVSGAVALLMSATGVRDLTLEADRPFVLADLLIGSVEELGEAGQDSRYGFGRIDVLRAIGFARDRGY